jgi:hypothetical protein
LGGSELDYVAIALINVKSRSSEGNINYGRRLKGLSWVVLPVAAVMELEEETRPGTSS